MGLDAPLPSSSGGYRGYRGRGRGASRSYFRGGPVMRGGPPRGSMKLDNRPKKLLVKGVHEDGSQALRDWYEVCQLFSFMSFGLGFHVLYFFRQLASWNLLSRLKLVHILFLSSRVQQRNRLAIPSLVSPHSSPII